MARVGGGNDCVVCMYLHDGLPLTLTFHGLGCVFLSVSFRVFLRSFLWSWSSAQSILALIVPSSLLSPICECNFLVAACRPSD